MKDSTIEFVERINISPVRKYLNNKGDRKNIFFEYEEELNDIRNILNGVTQNQLTPLKVVVMGEVKAGKSTFINSLIGKQVTYTNVLEATSAILEISYGEKDLIRIIHSDGSEKEIESMSELNELMDLKRNDQEYFSKIANIKIQTETQNLKKITLVDTPGLGTITDVNEMRTNDYINNSDVIIWILNGTHLGQNSINEKIEEIAENIGKPIIGVVNRIDEVNATVEDIIDYAEDMLGDYFLKTFAISSKKAWEGIINSDSEMIKESQINNIFDYIVENIEANTEKVQDYSTTATLEKQKEREIVIHKKISEYINNIIKKIYETDKEMDKFNNTLKIEIANDVNQWIEYSFLEKEKNELLDEGDSSESNKLGAEYLNSKYVENQIQRFYQKMNDQITADWQMYIPIAPNTEYQLVTTTLSSYSNDYSNLTPTTSRNNEMLNSVKGATVEGAIAGGAAGVGLAAYAAVLGPAASYITIGSALGSILPPLLVAGAIAGLALGAFDKTKSGAIRRNQIEKIFTALKVKLKDEKIDEIKNNLMKVSNDYAEAAKDVGNQILTEFNTSIKELEKILKENREYLSSLDSMK